MSQIKTFKFNKEACADIKEYRFGKNWPVVYVLENKNEVYVGQTVSAFSRSRQHLENPERQRLNTIHVISDEDFNLSAAFDTESWLIQFFAADGKYLIQNKNDGLKNHQYYDRKKYETKFEKTWEKLREMGIALNTLDHLKNTDLFKYSPYKTLSEDQLIVAKAIVKDIEQNNGSTFIISGKPGTGKTVLATYLCKYLRDKDETKHLNIGLVVPMTSLRTTISKVFSKVKGLKSGMVLGPNDVVKNSYDVLIVDEAHRLQRRKGIMGYGSFDQVNKKLGLEKERTQLDWILKSSKYQILFYDQNQSVKPADVRAGDFAELKAKKYDLKSQMRIQAGDDFIQCIEELFELENPSVKVFKNYDFQIFDKIEDMVNQIKMKDAQHKLSRVVSGYAWPWHTNPKSKKGDYDIDINGIKLIWNSKTTDWVNSPNALNEVGCIHTIQGYDLNFVGVIIGPELTYDPVLQKLVVNKDKYLDANGRNGTDPDELEQYIKNIYKTLLARGILGTYMYICDPALKKYFKSQLNLGATQPLELEEEIATSAIISPYTEKMVSVPLYDSIACGDPMYADPTTYETIDVPAALVGSGAKYFVLKASGDSMDRHGINDGDLILCQKNYHATSGIAVVLIGEDATLKEIKLERDGLLLIPKSTNPKHRPRKLTEDDEEFKVLGTFVKKLDLKHT